MTRSVAQSPRVAEQREESTFKSKFELLKSFFYDSKNVEASDNQRERRDSGQAGTHSQDSFNEFSDESQSSSDIIPALVSVIQPKNLMPILRKPDSPKVSKSLKWAPPGKLISSRYIQERQERETQETHERGCGCCGCWWKCP